MTLLHSGRRNAELGPRTASQANLAVLYHHYNIRTLQKTRITPHNVLPVFIGFTLSIIKCVNCYYALSYLQDVWLHFLTSCTFPDWVRCESTQKCVCVVDLYMLTDELLGQGAYAKVQGCVSLQNGNEYAVKVRGFFFSWFFFLDKYCISSLSNKHNKPCV